MTALPDLESEQPETAEMIRHRVKVEHRIYLVIVAVVSLIVGGIIGRTLDGFNRTESSPSAGYPTPFLKQNTPHILSTIAESATLSVYVSGAVKTSRVVTLAQGSLVVDAIEAVGGASDDANLDAINLAAPLRNHAHILVPRQGDVNGTGISVIQLDINTATTVELETLPNIGPTRAQHIVDYRESHGPFQDIEDIKLVSGIGQAIFEELAPFIYVRDK